MLYQQTKIDNRDLQWSYSDNEHFLKLGDQLVAHVVFDEAGNDYSATIISASGHCLLFKCGFNIEQLLAWVDVNIQNYI